jgi:LCP family protein required for cell wall assembly
VQLAGRNSIFIRTRTRRVLSALFVLVLIGALWFGWYAYHIYSGINQITNQGSTAPRLTIEPKIRIPPINSDKRVNILVLGSDTDAKKEEARPLAQSMIVVTIDPFHYKVSMLSIPRDFWVQIPGHGWGKIDLAYKYGGVSLARATVEKYFGIPIHHWAWVGLSGFTKVIDTFGGIDLDVNHPILDDFYPNDIGAADPYAFERVFIPEGWRHMSGRQALEYVRSRHGDLIGDFGRSSRQQQVLTQLRQKLTTLNILFNLSSLVDDLVGKVKTDLTLTELYQLESLSHHIQSQSVQKVVLQAPTYCTYGFSSPATGNQSILIPNWAAIRPVVKSLFAPVDTRIPRPRGTTALGTITIRVTPTPTATVGPGTPQPPTATPLPPTATSRPQPTSRPTSVSPRVALLPGRLIYIYNGNVAELEPDGSRRVLTSTAGLSMPAVSPDGRNVAFVRFRMYSSDVEVFRVRAAERSPVAAGQTMTHDESADVHNNLWAMWPQWSSDGRHLLFSSDRAKLQIPATEARQDDLAIYSMPSSGGAAVQMTTPDKGAGGDAEAQVRPGSNQILFVHWSYDQSNNPYSQLVLRDLVTGSTWTLTPPHGRAFQPAFDHAGNRVVYIRDDGSGHDQVVVSRLARNGSGYTLGAPTVIASGRVGQPAFAPGGRWVSYLQSQSDSFSLYLAPATGGPAVEITAAGSGLDATARPIWIR